jgi:hypothetical protein
MPPRATHPELLCVDFEKSASMLAVLSSNLERYRKKLTKTGAKIAYEKASSAISLSPGSPPILKPPRVVVRSLLSQFGTLVRLWPFYKLKNKPAAMAIRNEGPVASAKRAQPWLGGCV